MATSQPVGAGAFVPRNLVVLSDGTGNSSAKLFKTNVWRIYDALDLNCPDQVAFYDDGVGTASFQPLALLGGAFGFGLKRNVLDVYMFLCRNCRVDPEDPTRHDRIFAFGFSRGAFTARVVTALVAHEGLIQGADGVELKRLAAWAYRSYRADRYRNTWGVRVLRWMRNGLFRAADALRRRAPYQRSANQKVDIEFVGVWDTVAAYGLPIDELTRGWDQWIWPMLPRERRLSPRVKRACHALALDDERQTFFPLLWDESLEPQNARATHTSEERISQVWFAGVHSNVGGGYPDDGLALQPLCWLAGEAEQRGLRFLESLRPDGGRIPKTWIERATPCAPMHDSRRGMGSYYRYHPRPVARLCDDPDGLVRIVRPKIHESVFERIHDGRASYAPITLPPFYAVMTRAGRILAGDASATPPAPNPNPYEDSTQAASRVHEQQAAWNAVWWRRAAYFATVGVTTLVLVLPIWPIFDWVAPKIDAYPPLRGAVDHLSFFVPGFASGWLEHYRERPFQLVEGLLLIAALWWWSSKLKNAIVDRMSAVWRAHGSVAKPMVPVDEPRDVIYRLRTSGAYTRFFRFLSAHFWPTVFGITMLVILAVVVPVRIAFETVIRGSTFCPAPSGVSSTGPWELAFVPERICHATGIPIEEDATYQIQIALPESCPDSPNAGPRHTGEWRDDTVAVRSPKGLRASQGLVFSAALPLRRVINQDWFVPIATVGATFPERHALVRPSTTFVAGRDGSLTLFVNDAVFPCLGWDCLYRNNTGGPARVRVTKIADGQPPLQAADFAAYSCEEQRTNRR